MNYNQIQVSQLNKPDVSGYILQVVSPHTGTVALPTYPSGAEGQVQVKSGIYFGGSDLYFVSGKFGFGTTVPTSDFHISGKNFTVDGSGYFDQLYINSSRVITIDELNASGQFLDAATNSLSGFLTSNYWQTGYIDSNYYPRSNPSGYVTTGQTGNFLTSLETGNFVTSGQTGAFLTTGQTGQFLTDAEVVSSGQTGTFMTTGQSGDFVGRGETGAYSGTFALNSKTGVFVSTGQTGTWVSQGLTGSFLTTGVGDARYVNQAGGDTISGALTTSGIFDALQVRVQDASELGTALRGVILLPSTEGGTHGIYGHNNTLGSTRVGSKNSSLNTVPSYAYFSPQNGFAVYTNKPSLDGSLRFAIDSSGNAIAYGNFSGQSITGVSGYFVNRPLVNGTGVLLQGEAVESSQTGTYATTGWVNELYYPRTNPSGYGAGGGGGGVVVTNAGNNRIIKSDGTSSGLAAISELRFDGAGLTVDGYITGQKISGATIHASQHLDFTPIADTAYPSHQEGRVFYDDENKTVSVYQDISGVTLQLGQEEFLRVRNNRGATISNGEAVYINGVHGNAAPTVELAIATGIETAHVVGLATHDISDNSFGYVTTYGYVRDLDLSDFSVGDELYLSQTVSGGMTGVVPTVPNYQAALGHVINNSSSNGSFLVETRNPKFGGNDIKTYNGVQKSGVAFIDSLSTEGTAAAVSTVTGFIYDSGNGRLGLNVSSPQATLHVVGDITGQIFSGTSGNFTNRPHVGNDGLVLMSETGSFGGGGGGSPWTDGGHYVQYEGGVSGEDISGRNIDVVGVGTNGSSDLITAKDSALTERFVVNDAGRVTLTVPSGGQVGWNDESEGYPINVQVTQDGDTFAPYFYGQSTHHGIADFRIFHSGFTPYIWGGQGLHLGTTYGDVFQINKTSSDTGTNPIIVDAGYGTTNEGIFDLGGNTLGGTSGYRLYADRGVWSHQHTSFDNQAIAFNGFAADQGLELNSYTWKKMVNVNGSESAPEVVINENGYDVDFRVEATGQSNALFVRGSDGNVGIGTASPTYKFHVAGGITRLENSQSSSYYLDILGIAADGRMGMRGADGKYIAAWRDGSNTQGFGEGQSADNNGISANAFVSRDDYALAAGLTVGSSFGSVGTHKSYGISTPEVNGIKGLTRTGEDRVLIQTYSVSGNTFNGSKPSIINVASGFEFRVDSSAGGFAGINALEINPQGFVHFSGRPVVNGTGVMLQGEGSSGSSLWTEVGSKYVTYAGDVTGHQFSGTHLQLHGGNNQQVLNIENGVTTNYNEMVNVLAPNAADDVRTAGIYFGRGRSTDELAHFTFMPSSSSQGGRIQIGQWGRNDLMTIKGDGNVGIGTPDPSYNLHISETNSDGLLALEDSSASTSNWVSTLYRRSGSNKVSFGCVNNSSFGGSFTNGFGISVNDGSWNESFAISNDASKAYMLPDFGLGTTSPSARLHVVGSITGHEISGRGANFLNSISGGNAAGGGVNRGIVTANGNGGVFTSNNNTSVTSADGAIGLYKAQAGDTHLHGSAANGIVQISNSETYSRVPLRVLGDTEITGGFLKFRNDNFNTIIQSSSNINETSLLSNNIVISSSSSDLAAFGCTGASDSVFIGRDAGAYQGSPNQSVFIGYNAGRGGSDSAQTVQVGRNAGLSNAGSHHSCLYGYNAGSSSSYSDKLIAVGFQAGQSATGNNYAIFMGDSAGLSAPLCVGAVSIGRQASANSNTGSYNIALGYQANYRATPHREDFSIFIGRGANTDGSFISNVIAIGDNLTATTSNAVTLGNSSNKIGLAGVVDPQATLHVPGDITGQIISGTSGSFVNRPSVNGSGVLLQGEGGGGGGTPGGSSTQVQYNNGGSFEGTSYLTIDSVGTVQTGSSQYQVSGRDSFGGDINVDFQGNAWLKMGLTNNATFTGFHNMEIGRSVKVMVSGTSADRTVAVDPLVHFLGTKPTLVHANKVATFSFECYGPGIADIVAVGAVED